MSDEYEYTVDVRDTGSGRRSAGCACASCQRSATAHVQVVARPLEPAEGVADLSAQADAALAGLPVATTVVRRYREAPSPLVRDSVRNWRTGRVDRVLGGDFDLF